MSSRKTVITPFSRCRYLGLVLLLVCLIGLIWWGSFLATQAPYHDDDSYLSFDILPEHSVALMNQSCESDTTNGVCTWTKTTALDLESGDVWTPHNEHRAVLMHLGDDGEAHWLAQSVNVAVWDLGNSHDVRWIVTDLKSGRILKSVPYKFGIAEDKVILRERFIVTKRKNAIEVIDLDAQSPTPRSYPIANPNRAIHPVEDSGAFVVYGQATPPAQSLELFHIDDDGEVRSITSWSAMPSAPMEYVWPGTSGNEVATIGLNADQIVVRSTADGSIVRTVDLPDDFDPKKMTWRFSEDLLTYLDDRTLKILDWREGVSLPSVEDSDQHWRHSGSLIVVRGVSERRIIDVQTGEVFGKFQSMAGLTFYDQERAFVSSSKHGWTITEFDLASGSVSRQWQPFRYVVPSLIGWLIAYAAWCVCWTLASVRQGSRAWGDVLLIGGVPFGLLTFRAVISGDTLDAHRHVYQYAQGIAMAGATVALIWLVFGRTRITLRVMPLLCVFALIAAVLAGVFRHQPATAWHALASTFIPVAALSVWLVMLRILKWRIVIGDRGLTATPEKTRYPLRDLFWITLMMSAGFAAVRLFLGTADVLLDVNPNHWALLISQIVGIAAMIGALSRHRSVYRICVAIVFSAFVYLTVEPVARYASDRLYDIYPLLPTDGPQRILTTFPIATFALLLPYRRRGWRLR